MMNRKISAAIAATAIALTPACAQERVGTADKDAIEEIVRAYILENPEIIEEALVLLNEKQLLAEAEATSEAIRANYDDLHNNPDDYFIGPADAPVTLVEFFDYRCGYCKRSADWAVGLPEKYDNKVRVVFKELPILSTESEQAALASVAAHKQGKYLDFHMALMRLDNSTGFEPEIIDSTAETVGLDVELMRADMKSMAVQTAVANSKSLARTLGITGTPNFILDDQLITGANTARIDQLITAELEKLS